MAGKLNTELVRRRRQELNKQEEDRKQGLFWDKLNEGPNRRRILPPWSNEGNWRRQFGQHYNVLEKDTVLCPLLTFGQPCPLCDLNKTMFGSKDPDEKQFAKNIRGKAAFVANVLNLDKNDAKVYTLEFGGTMEADITKIIDPGDTIDEKTGKVLESFGYGDITDPKTGRNLLISKTVPADKMQTSYEVKASTQASEVPNWAEIEKQIHDLDAYVLAKQVHSYDDLLAMSNGTYVQKEKPTAKDMPVTEKPVESKPVVDEFGQVAKTNAPVKEADSEFTKPSGAPVVTVVANTAEVAKPVESSQPPKTMSALEKLRAMKGNK